MLSILLITTYINTLLLFVVAHTQIKLLGRWVFTVYVVSSVALLLFTGLLLLANQGLLPYATEHSILRGIFILFTILVSAGFWSMRGCIFTHPLVGYISYGMSLLAGLALAISLTPNQLTADIHLLLLDGGEVVYFGPLHKLYVVFLLSYIFAPLLLLLNMRAQAAPKEVASAVSVENVTHAQKKIAQQLAELKKMQANQDTVMLEISHGLQTPLSVIKNQLHGLMENQKDNKDLLAFEKSIDSVSALTNTMLHLSKIEFNEVAHHKFSLTELLNEQTDYYSIVCEAVDISFTSKVASNVSVEGNREQIEEAITNLVSNSLKYMKPKAAGGERKIHLTVTADTDVKIIVQDTGIGISNTDLPHIFDRFYRVANATTEEISGTGLGLALCRKIITLHNGTIVATSLPGVGTTMVITLPTAV